MQHPVYNARVCDHFFMPRHMGCLDQADHHVGVGHAVRHTMPDHILLSIHVDGQGYIDCAKFKAYGTPFTLAAASWTTEALMGCALANAKAWQPTRWIAALDLQRVQWGSAFLAHLALQRAIEHYHGKQGE